MNNIIYRQVINPSDKSQLLIQLPETFINKEVEVLAFEIPEKQPADEDERKLALEKAKKFFKSISIDMSNFKFDRDEANER